MQLAPINPTHHPVAEAKSSSEGEEALPGVLLGRRRRKKGKKKRKHRLGTDMTAMTSVFPFAAPPKGKSKNVTIDRLKGNLYSAYVYVYVCIYKGKFVRIDIFDKI